MNKTVDNIKSEKLEKLRKDYEHFNEYLIDKPLSDDLILQAYQYDIKKFRHEEEIIFILDEEHLDKNASEVLFLIRDLVNSKKSDRTTIIIGALKKLTDSSNWKKLDSRLNTFNDYTNRINELSLYNTVTEKVGILQRDLVLDCKERDAFSKFLLLKLIAYLTQNWESPLLYKQVIQGGMFDNESKIVSKSTFNRSSDCNEHSSIVLQKLLKILDKYKDNTFGFIVILSSYKPNYNSEYIKGLSCQSNFAIKLPLFKDVDYDSVLKRSNQILSDLNHAKTTNTIDLDKVVLFLVLVKHFKSDSTNYRYLVSSGKFSKYLGDSKVVSSIRDAFEEVGVFTYKQIAKAEIASNSYFVSISFDVINYKEINNAHLIHKLNQSQTLILGSNLDYKLELLYKVADVINSRDPAKTVNYTQVFLKSGMTSPLIYFLNLINALKFKLNGRSEIKYNENLVKSFSKLNNSVADMLYIKLYNMLLGVLSNNTIILRFTVPSLDIVSDNEIKKGLKKKFNKKFLINNPDKREHESEKLRKELQEIKNLEFIGKLKEFTGIE